MRRSEQTGQLAKAVSAARGEFKPIIKDKVAKVQTTKGYTYTYQYADLESVLEATVAALAKYEVMVFQNTYNTGKAVSTTTTLLHSSGEWVETDPFTITVGDDDKPQAYGSAGTYSRRYSIQGALNCAAELDDDSNLAQGNQATVGPKRQDPPQEPQKATADLLAQAGLWNQIVEAHGEGPGLDAWIRKALGNPTRARNKQGKWGFTAAEFVKLATQLKADEKELADAEKALL